MLNIEQIKNRLADYQPPVLEQEFERHAAVTMLLRDNGKETEVLLIRRAEHEKDPWSGDLGFPGGRIEDSDSNPRAAAERETWEEIGLCLNNRNYLGQSDDLAGAYLSVHISCFIYRVDMDTQFKLNGEVVDLFWVPINILLDPQRNQQLTFFYRGQDRNHPGINLSEWSNRPLWGITYRLLDNFFNLFDLSFTYPESLGLENTMKQTTRLVNFDPSCGNEGIPELKTINPPVFRASTVLFNNFEDLTLANTGGYKGITYGTDRLPTQRAFEEAIRELEGGALTRAFPSGISAIINVLLAFTNGGDHILVCDNAYGPTARFCNEILTKYNIETTYIPPESGKGIETYLRDNTKLIFLESPGSNTFEIQDIPAITALAKTRDIVTVLDNTWATPLYLDPFALGIDVSIQSVTKYISGHSDLLMGTATVNEKYAETLKQFYRTLEIYTPEEDCYTALRGLRTLPLRLKQHEQSALEIARWLEALDIIDQVLHPALPNHPQHQLWQRDFSGSSGIFAFLFKQEYGQEKLADFINSLQLFGIGYSWGGFKSLITAGKYNRTQKSRYAGRTIIRLNIGLEEPVDLISDLESGFELLK